MIDTTGLHKDHYTGAISEIKAIQYYLNLGCQVYTPTVQQGWVDFVVDMGDGDFRKIQVKTATWVGAGNYKYLQCRTRLSNTYKEKPSKCYDVLFIVYDKQYWEIPAIEIDSSNISLATTNPSPRNKKYKWDEYLVYSG